MLSAFLDVVCIREASFYDLAWKERLELWFRTILKHYGQAKQNRRRRPVYIPWKKEEEKKQTFQTMSLPK